MVHNISSGDRDVMKNQGPVKLLLNWYQKNKRQLPWRETRDPYRIWVSEVMLQQTQVSRVISYYERFLQRFPTVRDLAAAEWEDFLPYWQGLGFYSRGRNMLRAANLLVTEFGGEFPRDRVQLERLPGIAGYTSAAILSFAYDAPLPALDTNLKRVLQRYYGCTEKGVEPRATALFAEYSKYAATLNYALMDLGAMICQSRRVHCEICPLNPSCHFFRSGKCAEWEQAQLAAPHPRISSTKPTMEVAVACIHRDGKYLICKRSERKGGAWEFPGGKREKGEDWRHALQREIREELGIEISVRPHFFEEVWEEREFMWRLRFFRCQILKGEPQPLEHDELKWIASEELKNYEFPVANAKALEKLQRMKFPA